MSERKLSRGITSTSNFCAHRLVFTQGKVSVKQTAGNYIFFSIFALIGLGIIAAAWLAKGDESARIPMTIFGIIFSGVGFGGMFWKHNRLPEIDLMRRMFYPERKKYDTSDMTNISSMGGIPLSELVKIQVSTRHVRGNKSSYTAYMLDLVFRDGYSCRLLSRGARKQFTEDAEKLAQVLNMPLVGLEEVNRQLTALALKTGGIIMIIFSIFWLSICSSMIGQMIVPALKKFDPDNLKPEIVIQLIFPGIFILVGVGMFIGGIKTLIKSLKSLKKD